MTKRQSKILGGLLGGAVGDAMGAATETRTTALIKEKWGGLVKDIIDPPDDTYAHGTKAGLVTDDFSVAYYSAEDIVAAGGQVTPEIAKKAVLRWATHPEYTRYAGPTTRDAIVILKGETPAPTKYDHLLCDNRRATNGAGMKSGPIGLIDACNVDKAIDDAIIYCMPTHDNVIALSGACAVAAAVAKSMNDNATMYDAVQAGIYGAAEGYKRAAKVARPVAGPSIEKRIQLAVELGLKYGHDFEKAMTEIADIIGTGLHASEAVPAAFGFMAACNGRVMDTIYMAVNGGSDTDTVAIMAGSIAGTLCGAEAIPLKYLTLIDRMNNFDLKKLTLDIDGLLG